MSQNLASNFTAENSAWWAVFWLVFVFAAMAHATAISAILLLGYGTKQWWLPAVTGGRLVFVKGGRFGARNVFALTAGSVLLWQLFHPSGHAIGSVASGAGFMINILLPVALFGGPIWLFVHLFRKYKAAGPKN